MATRQIFLPAYLFLGASWLDQDSEVSNLVWYFMEQDCNGGDDAHGVASQIGSSDGQTIREIVGKISCQI